MNALLVSLYGCLCLVCCGLICILLRMLRFYLSEQAAEEDVTIEETTKEYMEGEENEKNEEC